MGSTVPTARWRGVRGRRGRPAVDRRIISGRIDVCQAFRIVDRHVDDLALVRAHDHLRPGVERRPASTGQAQRAQRPGGVAIDGDDLGPSVRRRRPRFDELAQGEVREFFVELSHGAHVDGSAVELADALLVFDDADVDALLNGLEEALALLR